MTPASWRGRPPGEALRWVADAIGAGAEVVAVRRLGRGGWMATHAVDVRDAAGSVHRLVLRRWARPGWQSDAEFTAAKEARVLRHLARTTVAAPEVVAVDPDGSSADVPALLLVRLPGAAPRHAASRRPRFIRRIAEALVAIHALDDARELVPPFRPFHNVAGLAPPPASDRSDLWRQALTVASGAPSTGRAMFLHRDFHPGNTLWLGGRLSGIVDWTGASTGSPAADLAHLRANLGIGHDPETADAASAAYVAAGGATADQAWWDVRIVLDFIPEFGERLGAGAGLARVERYLETVLRRL